MRLQVGAAHASLEAGNLADFVEGAQPVHVAHIHGQHGRRVRQRVDMPGDAGAAAIGDDPRANCSSPGEQRGNILGVLRIGDAVGECLDLPAA